MKIKSISFSSVAGTELKKSKYETFYHGSDHEIKNFNFDNVNSANANEAGPGIYFTTNLDDARRYGKKVYELQIKIVKSRMMPERKTLNESFVIGLIKKSPELLDTLSDWGETPKIALNNAVSTIMSSYGPNEYRKAMETIWYDFYKGFESQWLSWMRVNGWDGLLRKRTEDTTHFICYNIDTIKSIKKIS